MTFFNDQISQMLLMPLAKEDVSQRAGTGTQKLSYLTSPHVIETANRIFGHGNWSTEIMNIHQVDKTVYEKPPYKAGDSPKEMISIAYTCHIKLTVTGEAGVVSHEDVGFGDGVAGNTPHGIHSCIELG